MNIDGMSSTYLEGQTRQPLLSVLLAGQFHCQPKCSFNCRLLRTSVGFILLQQHISLDLHAKQYG